MASVHVTRILSKQENLFALHLRLFLFRAMASPFSGRQLFAQFCIYGRISSDNDITPQHCRSHLLFHEDLRTYTHTLFNALHLAIAEIA